MLRMGRGMSMAGAETGEAELRQWGVAMNSPVQDSAAGRVKVGVVLMDPKETDAQLISQILIQKL